MRQSGGLVLLVAGLFLPPPARAETVPSKRWCAAEVQGGILKPDNHLADYQWDVMPHASLGVAALVGQGRFAAGLRFLIGSTTQEIGVPTPETSATVKTSTLELVGRGRIATLWGNRVMATANAGRVHLGYSPDRVEVLPSGSSTPVIVELAPVDEWIVGAGLAVRRPLGARFEAGIDVDHRIFSMETAHRNGDAIERDRETFGNWGVRFALAWRYGSL